MPIRKKLAKRNTIAVIIFFILFLLFLGTYFSITFKTKTNALKTSINIIQDAINSNILLAINNNIAGMHFIFLVQLITFTLAIISLLLILWHVYQLYLIQLRNALIDPLIEIYNRRAVMHELKIELRRSERYKLHTCVAMVDLDFFKKYNDTNGHVAGDRLLKRFKAIFKKSLREYDVFGRYGGEEFIIIFPRTKLQDAVKICKRLRKLVEKTYFIGQQNMPNKNVTISIGVAEFTGKGKIKKEILIHKADLNLYKAKSQGRNKVVG